MRLWVAATEASGDALGAALLPVLRARHPDLTVRGVGGPGLQAAGLVVAGQGLDGVVGLAEAVRQVPRALGRLRAWEADIRASQPDVVLTIDSPSLLLRLGRRLEGVVPVAHWVAPQVWAWRPGRAARVVDSCDLLCCLLPFEPAWFGPGRAAVRFTGHPAGAWRDRWDPQGPIALFPGSREAEVRQLWPVFREVAGRLATAHPGLGFRIAQAPGVPERWLGGLAATFVVGEEALDGARAALVCSGTASLQAAAAGIPQVVAYRVNPLSWAVGRRLASVEHVALPNVLAGRTVIPEHLQVLDPDRIAASLGAVLDPAAARTQREALRPVLAGLEATSAVDRVAEALSRLAARRSSRPARSPTG